MNDQITVTMHCEKCNKQVTINPDRYTDSPEVSPSREIIPIRGVCPECNTRYEWNPNEMYLSKFEPISGQVIKEGEPVTMTIAVTEKLNQMPTTEQEVRDAINTLWKAHNEGKITKENYLKIEELWSEIPISIYDNK